MHHLWHPKDRGFVISKSPHFVPSTDITYYITLIPGNTSYTNLWSEKLKDEGVRRRDATYQLPPDANPQWSWVSKKKERITIDHWKSFLLIRPMITAVTHTLPTWNFQTATRICTAHQRKQVANVCFNSCGPLHLPNHPGPPLVDSFHKKTRELCQNKTRTWDTCHFTSGAPGRDRKDTPI